MILEQVLLEFPLVEVEYRMPRWVEMLPLSHPVKQQVVETARSMMEQFRVLRDVGTVHASVEETCISKVKLEQVARVKAVPGIRWRWRRAAIIRCSVR